MKRYWLFGGETHYAAGGMHDLLGTFDSIRQAVDRARTLECFRRHPELEWWHVYDSEQQRFVEGTIEQAYGAPSLLPGGGY